VSNSNPKAIVLSVGTELTEGIIINSHLQYLSSGLNRLGFTVIRGIQIPDILGIFTAELGRAAEECSLIIVTGGLGPTSDDLTREAIAEAAGTELVFQRSIWEDIKKRYSGQKIAETNRKQAYIPQGFEILKNPVGSAPGFYGRINKSLIIALPGPPGELEAMYTSGVERLIEDVFTLTAEEVLTGTAMLIPESRLEEQLQKCPEKRVKWGTRVADDRIIFYLRGGKEEEREAVFSCLQESFGSLYIRKGDVKPAQLLSRALRSQGLKIALAESCTGGLLGKLLTDLPGSSDIFFGGVTAYSIQAKIDLLGIDNRLVAEYGAVSSETAAAMTEATLKHCDVVLAVTGIAGPGGGTAQKPVGTVWISFKQGDRKPLCRLFRFHGSRDQIRRKTAVAAFLLAESELKVH
jgi:nicotinamide-nucleotide amidase